MQAYPICSRCGCRLQQRKERTEFVLWCSTCKTVFVRYGVPPQNSLLTANKMSVKMSS